MRVIDNKRHAFCFIALLSIQRSLCMLTEYEKMKTKEKKKKKEKEEEKEQLCATGS